jgi:histidyl-tRNA synthetase
VSDESRRFAAPKGTRDVLPPESGRFERLVGTFALAAHRYGFGLLVSPLIEDVGVFNRGIGEQSEVTRKEMYVFEDRSGRPLALRPEGTASVVRAYVQHHPTAPWKVWYLTPAFRYEQPQEGRYRQHHQLGVEAIGTDDPGVDVEVIALAWRYYGEIGLRDVRLLLNSMGDATCRPAYIELLMEHLSAHESELCDEHARTWRENPLRVLDCKREPCVRVTEAGPMLIDHLCDACAAHFAAVREGLAAIEVPFRIEPRLVRGFDYYTRTTFEFASTALSSAQNAIGGGGRYDGLVAELGGEPTGGIGFGSGIERLSLALDAESVAEPPRAMDVFVVDTTGGQASLSLLEELRRAGVAADRAYDGRSMKAQMKLADRSGARVALIIGPAELESGTVTMRDLRGADGERQSQIARGDVVATVRRQCVDTD